MNKRWIYGSSALFLFVALVIVIWWLGWGRFVRSTDDAYVHGNQVRLTPQIDGYVTSIHAEDTELVEEGQILVTLDATDRMLAFNRACTDLALKVRQVTQLFETAYLLAAEYEKAHVQVLETEVLYKNRKEVVESGAISEEEYVIAEANYYAAQAMLMSAQYNLMRGISEVQNTTIETHPMVESAKANLREAYVNLQRCTLRSPVTGIIAQRNVQVGESVAPNMPLLSIIPLNQMWIEANFKEVDLDKVRIGQTVRATADLYGGGVVYTGTVIGIGIGTGAVFSPLPPQNATGNWIKIVQRIPVRISLHAGQLQQHPLRLGLSMNASIDVHDISGSSVPPRMGDKVFYETDVFKTQIDGSEEVIQKILQDNSTWNNP